ncbi:hypothetical protein [Streptomyces sp. 6N106]|uniref:hypothetical protein n=1 Tax=Streptomyces sp. 6N106 TaxID=3457418 RepID=UPI000B831410
MSMPAGDGREFSPSPAEHSWSCSRAVPTSAGRAGDAVDLAVGPEEVAVPIDAQDRHATRIWQGWTTMTTRH